ncbi:two-component system, chemotaxis family, response regulator CheY [Colwellia chukchiensis]|uniref:Two-component system, chemotaxis family, response regulator CheY n=1 Tax=Colwellia chukchiensis TaxID=641665 RepID=A0A1H7S741_9GAMM|nr:response regulator [Colwellia chukchiensis]SEL68188.1 two-component system, chemotaxis family, response regulator CheY [Colwellia chukchiensis]
MKPNELSLLVVEPSDTQRKIIIKELTQQGITQVAQAKNIADAYQSASKHPRDLITSAMHFSDGSALDLLQKIRNNPAIADTPFMLVSSEHRREHLEAFKQSGVIALLPKPFTSAHLATAIRTTIDLLATDELALDYFDVHQVRVLLVDDSRLARNHIKRVLNNLGLIKITEAVDGSEAITLLKANMFDLVVTDYNMPEVNGKALTHYIRNQSTQSHLPILMVTSESNDTHLANILTEGVTAMCDKPFEPAHVKQILYRLLED